MTIKKFVITGLLLFPFFVFGQKDSTLKIPNSKSFMVEMNFNPFGEDGVFSFDNLQTKIWVSNKSAIRLGVQFDRSKNEMGDDSYHPNNYSGSTYSEKSFLFGIKPGMEFRILENSKVSPYWGFELMFTKKSSSAEYTDYTPDYNYNNGYSYIESTSEIEGSWRSIEYGTYQTTNGYYSYTNINYEKERAYKAYGINFMLGADYFFVKNMYVGLELGVGYKITEYETVDVDFSDSDETIKIPSRESSDFGFYYNNSFRIGIWF